MTSESESEEFFDAFDITPSKILSPEESCSTLITAQSQPILALSPPPKSEFTPDNEIKPSHECQVKTTAVSHKNPWRSRTASPLLDPLLPAPSLSGKLAFSLPTLHLQENTNPHQPAPSCAQSLLMTLEKPFTKNEDTTLMPPPKDIPIKPDTILSVKNDLEESNSACSTSLLDTLGAVEEEEESHNQLQWRRRRARQRKAKNNMEEDESAGYQPPSPNESQSSSVDALFPSSQTSAPFRVVEVDATSIYSTTFSQDKGSKTGGKVEEKVDPSSSLSKNINEKPSDVKEAPTPENKNEVLEPGGVVTLSPEPDVVASTKSNSLPRVEAPPVSVIESMAPDPTGEEGEPCTPPLNLLNSPQIRVNATEGAPVAPPRRNKKRRRKDDEKSISECQDTVSISSLNSLPAPTFSLAFKNADVISHHLDLHAASKGDYIVSPLDTEDSRAPRSSRVLRRTESTGDTTSQASTPETTRASDRASDCRLVAPPSNTNKPLSSTPNSSSTSPNTPSTESVSSGGISGESETVKCATVAPPKSESAAVAGMTDEEILRQVSVLNLDTGERIPLSEAEECLPSALNPLSLHIMRLTSEYISSKMDQDDEESDEESIVDVVAHKMPEINSLVVKKKTHQLKKFLGKTMESAVNKAKTLAQEVSHRGKEEKDVFEDDAPAQNTMQYVKIKTSHSHKGPHEFDNLMYVQELKGEHTGPVWCMKFSPCGRLLATAGQDHILRVWVLKQAFNYFLDIRTKWNADVKSSPTPSQESLVSQHSSHSSEDLGTLDPSDDGLAPFMPKPFCVYSGHSADVLDLSWSKNYFMLTSSMDKTVRLWHISRKECLCIFKHVDFVTAIAFHPKDDRYFISGSLDGKLRLWSIPEKQVVMWNEVEGHPKLITAANFCQNGTFIVVGTYNGRCIFYKTKELKYFTQIHVKSTRGKNARGRKITGIEPLPEKDMLLITSNDSRIRLYDLNVLTVSCKYKGYSNISSQIRAGFSHDGKYIIAGSENQCIYIWKTHHDYSKFSSARKDRNVYWEGVKAHSAVVNCAIFSPRPDHVFNFIDQQEMQNKQKNSKSQESMNPSNGSSNGSAAQETSTSNKGYVLVSADYNGCVKVFLQKERPKHSSLPASALA